MSIDDLEFMIQKLSASSISVGDLESLIHFCRDKDVVVELGTNVGSTAMLLSAVAKKVHTVDLFEDVILVEDEEQRRRYIASFLSNRHTFEAISTKLAPFGVTVHKGFSYEAASKFKEESVDVVFIDADHSYSGVKKDYDAWFDRVKIGGYFIFHDVVAAFPVFDYINEVILLDTRVEKVEFEMVGKGSTMIFRKR